ncbi:MAG: DUF1553 domain-containing protein [Blastocatellia bacterium]
MRDTDSAGKRSSRLIIIGLLITAGTSWHAATDIDAARAQTNETVSFNRDIRPIFSGTCYACHGPDKNARKAGLRLDIREEALKKTRAGVAPIVPGKPGESEIVQRIFSANAAEIMPPPDAHKILTPEQKELIRRWIAEGAKYEGHWSWQPVRRPAIPQTTAAANIRNPVDTFIQARLTRENMQPAPEAGKRTLIRRVSLDITGIPPTPAEINAFVNDKAPDAYERLVDRLLASDRYAEKQAMHWLDAARYGDTAGFHGDNAMPTWPYRDYVLRAFRDNKPFDEFTREQLAGDLMLSATADQRIASAYNRLNRVSAEGGLQPKEYLAKYAADRVRTTSIVWLGATMGCAECHDHKFDPFLAKDFYAMKAFFADIRETGLVPDRGREGFGSKMALPSTEQQQRFNELSQRLAWLRSELDDKAAMDTRRGAWEKSTLEQFKAGKLAWQFQRPVSATAQNGTRLTIVNDETLSMTQYLRGSLFTADVKGDGLVIADGPNPDNETITARIKPGAGQWTALGLNVVQDESLPANRLARGADRFVISEIETELSAHDKNAARKIPVVLATTDGVGQMPENHAMNAIDGNAKTGWGVMFGDGRDAFITLRFAEKVQTTADTVITVTLRQEAEQRRATIGRFRLALSAAEHSWPDHMAKTIHPQNKPLNGLPQDVAIALNIAEDKRSDAQKRAVFTHYKWAAPEWQAMTARLARLEADFDMLDGAIPRVVVTESVTPMETRILPRGNFLDESGEVVEPAIPVVFGKLGANARRANRLDLANWIVSKDNPLTARVYVNRLWRQFLGAGLTKTLDDLGSQGEWPTHPELLDWLASEFMHPSTEWGMRNAEWGMKDKEGREVKKGRQLHDWDVKHVIRLIVTSHTYRQSSSGIPHSELRNPQSSDIENRLLARQNRFRVDAELVRDIALSVSGLLVEQFGGPSARPYQPDRYLFALNFPQRDYSADRGANLYRRGVYTHWQRTFLHPSLQAFDAPSREECTVNRMNSNTPLQALVLMNDPIFVESARVFAQNAMKQGGAAMPARIAWAFERALGRKANAGELRVLGELYKNNLARFVKDTNGARELLRVGDAPVPATANVAALAAMTTVTRAILNLHETITRN